ncbi:MAG: chemotaxis protein CheW [Pseudomonadota bacterium]
MTSKNLPDAVLAASQNADESSQFLTFLLADEEYGIDILKVQEIRGWTAVTPIPNTPEHVLGVLNLRGAVVPIVDLRRRFALAGISYTTTTVIIVVSMVENGVDHTVGLVVDAVADVHRLDTAELHPPPEMGSAIDTEFVRALATVNDKMVILLDADKLIRFEDTVTPTAGAAPPAVAASDDLLPVF